MVDYKIECKNDFAKGAYLVTRIPQNKVDKNALYTISADPPRFMLPLAYKNIDGEMEVVYEVGSLSKLAYFRGELSKDDYIDLWTSLLEPLLNCGDWFLTPNSFVLDMEYLYYDKRKKTAVYVYVPSIEGNSNINAFSDMAAALSKIITSSDTALENKVLRFILENSTPREFIEMLKEYTSQRTILQAGECDAPAPQITHDTMKIEDPAIPRKNPQAATDRLFQNQDGKELFDFDYIPEISEDKSTKRARKESGRYMIFGTKSKKKKEPTTSARPQPKQQLNGDFTLQENNLHRIEEKIIPQPQKQTMLIEITESIPVMLQKTSLKCVGKTELPQLIDVEINEGDIFSIGRYDAAVGKKLSTFEFDKKTKAVSRRHAVIERDDEGYKIIDISSRAGTFVDGQKLPPNTPFRLAIGTRVSFGNFGADYVWDVS